MIFLPGDILFTRDHGSRISEIIAEATGAWHSHAGLIKEHTEQSIYTIEPSEWEITIQTFNERMVNADYEYEVWRLPLSQYEREKVIEEAMRRRGQFYGYLQVASLGLRRLLMHLGIRSRNLIRQGMICVGVVTYGYRRISVPALSQIDPEGVDTKELYDLVTSIPGAKLVDSRRI